MPVGDRLMGTGGNVGAKRERESGEVERLKKELNRLNKQMNDLKNECDQLRKDRTKKDQQIKAKEVEIQNLKKANGGFAGKDVCGIVTNTDKSVHVTANGALHAANTWASTRTDKLNGKVKGTRSLQQDLGSKQRHQTDLPQALELKDLTMIDNKDILALLQCIRLPDKLGTSSETSSSMNDAIPNYMTYLLRNNVSVEPYVDLHVENKHKDSSTVLITPGAEDLLRWRKMSLPFSFWSSVFSIMLQTGIKYSDESIRVDALSIMILIVRTTDPKEERQKFEFTSTMEKLHQLLQKDNGFLVKMHSVRLLFLLLNCPAMLKLLCCGGKDGSEQISEGSESDRSKQAIRLVLEDLSECLTCDGNCSQGIELCRLAVILLAYIASSGKLGYEVLLGSVTTRGASFLELIMEVLASQMQYETQELLKERCLLMREALILLNRLASHANFSKPTLEVLTGSKLCATMTIDVANRLPQTQTGNDLGELAQKFRSRVHAFLEEKPLAADGSYSNASFKSYKFQEQTDSSVIRSNPRFD
ncbi:hypothetical protein PR202_gb06106 [Eleusine coracana subsp. coracana]|uniref:Uncharacterized protein n=1 Tax=Eleusine coracana subsp. coracana TaxID=191504 RepID=A0AAV5E9G1_ELECO|nr:hypothetical protein PR202_gb06106 [Eleusine coracana subsp. coracana]